MEQTAQFQRNAWLLAGFCFFVSSICNLMNGYWLGYVNLLIAGLSLYNAYTANKKMKSDK
ncbi:MAG: hypothetical protein ACRCST_06255 [Turicibacter sp.]